MEQQVHNMLARYEQDLCGEIPEGEKLLERLQQAQLERQRVEPMGKPDPTGSRPRSWLLFVKPTEPLLQRFGLAPEVLVLLSPFRIAQARDISGAENTLTRDLRLDRGLVMFIARDPKARNSLEQAARNTGRVYVFQSFDDILDASDPQRWLRALLRKEFGSSDLFSAGDPVYGWQFVGRSNELRSLRRYLRDGKAVGLYGLRKVGKSSALLNVRRQLIEETRASLEFHTLDDASLTIPVHVDLQTISFAELNRTGFQRTLVRRVYDTLQELEISPEALGLEPDLGKTRVLRDLDAHALDRKAIQVLERLIEWASESAGRRRVLLLIDEYEFILGNSSFPARNGVEIFGYLRGQAQSYSDVFTFSITGLSRRLAAQPTLAGMQNPLHNFVVDFPLAGLTREEMRDLLRNIGRRLGLDFAPEALDLIWQQTGGHPFLVREYGFVVDGDISSAEREPKKTVTADIVQRLQETFHRRVANTMAEIGRAVTEIDPDAPLVLSYALGAPDQAGQTLNELNADNLEELRRLGVLHREHQQEGAFIRIGCFGDWLANNWESGSVAATVG